MIQQKATHTANKELMLKIYEIFTQFNTSKKI